MRKQDSNRKLIIGLTGSFGSGKSTVARIFKFYGAQIIDADGIAHRIIKPKNLVYKKIIAVFGKGILKKDKTIDRHKLAKVAFSNKDRLMRLNKSMHPEIIRIIKERIRALKSKLIILDAPLLIEAGITKIVDKLIVVKITKKKQIERILKKSSFERPDILERIRHQMPLANKAAIADFVIDNSGTLLGTRKQVIKIIKRLIPRNSK